MTTPDRPDRLPILFGGIGLVIAIAIVVLALYATKQPSPQPTTPAASVQDLERALVSAKKACVEGPPQGPSCVEAARLTTELAKAKGTP